MPQRQNTSERQPLRALFYNIMMAARIFILISFHFLLIVAPKYAACGMYVIDIISCYKTLSITPTAHAMITM
jgi:hypothetical protein